MSPSGQAPEDLDYLTTAVYGYWAMLPGMMPDFKADCDIKSSLILSLRLLAMLFIKGSN
jgi:hypothetical protein